MNSFTANQYIMIGLVIGMIAFFSLRLMSSTKPSPPTRTEVVEKEEVNAGLVTPSPKKTSK